MLGSVHAVAARANFSGALLDDGTLRLWGDDATGNLGDDGTNPQALPVTPVGNLMATQLVLGGRFACALLADGSVRCWGDNTSGDLGNGGTSESRIPTGTLL
jgi:alpha-tubulin suppressor-like RCC1 family protein